MGSPPHDGPEPLAIRRHRDVAQLRPVEVGTRASSELSEGLNVPLPRRAGVEVRDVIRRALELRTGTGTPNRREPRAICGRQTTTNGRTVPAGRTDGARRPARPKPTCGSPEQATNPPPARGLVKGAPHCMQVLDARRPVRFVLQRPPTPVGRRLSRWMPVGRTDGARRPARPKPTCESPEQATNPPPHVG